VRRQLPTSSTYISLHVCIPTLECSAQNKGTVSTCLRRGAWVLSKPLTEVDSQSILLGRHRPDDAAWAESSPWSHCTLHLPYFSKVQQALCSLHSKAMQAAACPCCLACRILQKTEIFQDCDFSFQQTPGKGPKQIWKHGQHAHSPGTRVTRQWWICRLSELAWQYCFWGKQVVADCFQCYSSCCTGGLLLAGIATRHD